VTETTAPPPKITRGSIRDLVAAHPTAVGCGLYAIAAVAAAIAAYLALFTQFAAWDDEGTLLVTLKAFAHGGTLYRNIYSEYGPFYYEVFGGLLALTGHAVTTDLSRSVVIVVWVSTSLLFGLVAQRLTGRLLLGVAGMITAFGVLFVLAGEPMHPHGLAVLLLAAFTLLAVSGPTRRVLWAGGGCGALLAALALTKVNLGAFAIAAVALAAVLTFEPLHRRRWLRGLVIAAFLALPFLIMARDLNESWVRELVALEVFAAGAVVVAAWPARARRGESDADLSRWLLAAAIGFAVAFAAILVVILLTGPTLSDVYDGVIVQATRVRDVLTVPLPFPTAAVDWGIAALAAAALTARLRFGEAEAPTIWPGLLRAVAGLTIWLTIARIAPLGLHPSAGNPDTVPLVLAWVAAIPPAGSREPAYRRFLRVLLPALAVAETLQVYPVAGSQIGIASLAFVPVGALCLSDALTSLRAWSAARGALALERFGVVVGVLTVALAAELAFDSILRPTASNAVLYRNQPSLSVAGASLMHLPASDAETYAGLVEMLHRHRCTSFIGYPSINSLYLWSGIEAPPPTAPGAWMKMLDNAQQQRIVDELRASPRPCAVRSDTRAAGWLQGQPPPQKPLVRYVFEDFKPIAEVGDFKFLVPKTWQPSPSSSRPTTRR
jgi:hypothetical protein